MSDATSWSTRFSRYAVGWTIQHRESASIAEQLIAQSIEQQAITPGQLTIHADRGPSMRSKPVAFPLSDLGVTASHLRSCSVRSFQRTPARRPGQTQGALKRLPLP